MSYKKDKWDELERLRDRLRFLHNCELDPPRYEEELSILNKILKLDPEDKVAWTFKGDILLQLEEDNRTWIPDAFEVYEKNFSSEALRCFENALEIDSNFSHAILGKGNVLLYFQKFKDAIRCYNKVIEIDESLDVAWYKKGLALHNLKKYDEALECFEFFSSLEEENMTDTEMLYRKYETLMKLGRKEEAIVCYEQAFDCKPNDESSKWKKYVYVGFAVFLTVCFVVRFAL